MYPRLSRAMEPAIAERRSQLLAGLSGAVIEVGAGDGMNFAHYPAEVTRVVAVEPQPYLRGLARGNAERAPVPIEVVAGAGEHLPVRDGAFDAAVASLVLCSVADPEKAVAELFRAIRAGGQLRFFEHVRATTSGLRRFQGLLDATVWPLVAGGCHTGRDTAAAIARTGFTGVRFERFEFPDFRLPLPTSPHIIGVASRP